MPSTAPTPLEHHYQEAERVLATIGSLGVVEEEAQRGPHRAHACSAGPHRCRAWARQLSQRSIQL
jgi:hypothetical protein